MRLRPECLFLIILVGCSGPMSMGAGSESWMGEKRQSRKEESKTQHTGAPALIKKGDKTYNISSRGSVTINPVTEGANDLAGVTPELLEKLGQIMMSSSSQVKTNSQYEAQIEAHKKWHTISAVVLGAMAVLILVMVFAMVTFRKEITKYGFDPKSVGKSARRLMRILTKAKGRVENTIDYIDRRISENHLEDGVRSELQRQRNALSTARDDYAKVEEYEHDIV